MRPFLPSPTLAHLSSVLISTRYTYAVWLYDSDVPVWDPNGILTWLAQELDLAERAGQRAWISTSPAPLPCGSLFRSLPRIEPPSRARSTRLVLPFLPPFGSCFARLPGLLAVSRSRAAQDTDSSSSQSATCRSARRTRCATSPTTPTRSSGATTTRSRRTSTATGASPPSSSSLSDALADSALPQPPRRVRDRVRRLRQTYRGVGERGLVHRRRAHPCFRKPCFSCVRRRP